MADTNPSNGPFKLCETPYHTKGKVPEWRIAAEMGLAHNSYIRSLNAIYLQATGPTTSRDKEDLLTYCQCWYEALQHHHDVEEGLFFPSVEKETGLPGLMDINVEQHKMFHPGVEEFGKYVNGTKPEEYDGHVLQKMINEFAPALVNHLHEEIGTLQSLVQYDPDGSKLKKCWDAFDAKIVAESSKARLFPLVLGSLDNTFEGGIHHWPDIPFFVPYLVDYVFTFKHRGAWRFAPSDIYGNPRPLQFLPKS